MLYFMYVFFSPPCCFFFFFLPHLALINGPLLTFTHAPPDVRKLPPAILPVLSFSLFALLSLPLLLLFSPSASTRFVFPCPSPFQTSGFRASYFGLRVFGFSVLYLLLSFLKVNCSPRCCFSACERGEVPADYLAAKMIKVAEHLHLFTLAACMSALVPEACACICLLDVTAPLRVCNCFYSHYELHPTCV